MISEIVNLPFSDFGMSRILPSSNMVGITQSTVGPLKWMAPESVQNREYSVKSGNIISNFSKENTDVWAFGILIVELVTHEPPYKGMQGITNNRIIFYLKPLKQRLKFQWVIYNLSF